MIRRALLGVLAIAALAAPSSALAQSSGTGDLSMRRSTFVPWVDYRSITVKDSSGSEVKISQLSVPVTLNVRLGSGVTGLLYGAFADTKLEPQTSGAASQSLSALTDVRAKVFFQAAGNTIFSLGASLPTGKHALSADEEIVAAAAATDVLGLRVRRFGEGADGEAGVTRAFAAGDNGAVALGLGVLYKGSFEPAAGSTAKYRPGTELSASGGYDYRTPTTLVRLNAAFRGYTKDQADGVPAYKQGSQFALEERLWSSLGGRATNDVSAHQVFKGQSDSYSGTDGSVLSGSTENGSSFGVSERLGTETASGMSLAALLQGDFYGKSGGPAVFGGSGYDSAHLLGFGGELGFAPSSTSTIRFDGRLLTGKIQPGDVKLSGFAAGATARVNF